MCHCIGKKSAEPTDRSSTHEDEVCSVYMYHTHSKWVFVLQIKEPTSDGETLISAQNSNEDGSSVDPIPVRDEAEVRSIV